MIPSPGRTIRALLIPAAFLPITCKADVPIGAYNLRVIAKATVAGKEITRLATVSDVPFAIYVHVPFCASRCGYCAFNTYTAGELGGDDLRRGYAAAARQEIAAARAPCIGSAQSATIPPGE